MSYSTVDIVGYIVLRWYLRRKVLMLASDSSDSYLQSLRSKYSSRTYYPLKSVLKFTCVHIPKCFVSNHILFVIISQNFK